MRRCVLLLSVLFSTAAMAAPYQSYEIRGTRAYTASYANGVNKAGEVVGVVESEQGEQSSFVTRNGKLVLLESLGGEQGNANAINDAGIVAGTAQTHERRWHAFMHYPDGRIEDLGTLGGPGSVARAINNRGQVTGYSDTDDGHWHGFLYEDGRMTDIGTLGGRFSAPMGINNDGTVVGMSERGDGQRHAFVYTRAGGLVDIGTLGGRHSMASGINDQGLVVGTSETKDHRWHAFTWDGKTMRDLGPAIGWGNSYGAAVNSHGRIVGTYIDGLHRTFVYEAGDTRFMSAEDSLYRPTAINDEGLIVGQRVSEGKMKALMLIPSSRALPSLPIDRMIMLLAAVGLLLVALEARRQRRMGTF
ncbi:HAF repeat-containing protein [Massilia arenosa]|uniref:HAF repeat-containing protein n=1 Tax=Zemynaea arenosa TaxID=2561931 RepID=A0A4Y9SGU7_9BURK|nr:HAF repeat-containing protein [Massilia arenosa]TFW23581.1 HAF repeat-containing protein [Massilia arenosa]